MKLIYVCRNCTLLGGQARIAWEVALEAAREGHEIHLVARRFPKVEPYPASVHNHRVFQLPRLFGKWRSRSFARLSSNQVERLHQKDAVAHGFGDNYRQDILTLGNVDWNYARYIPGRQPDQTALHIKKRALQHPGLRFLVLPSQQMRGDLLDLYPDYDMSKVRVIYPGVDIARYSGKSKTAVRSEISKKFGVPSNKVWIVTAAGGDFVKRNTATLAQALLKLRKRADWVFLLVGGKENEVNWPSELHDRSYFLGRLDDISTVLPGCDLMAYPAWYDESPLVCLESLASGLPLVISHKVGTSAVMSDENKKMGVLRDPKNSDELASLIENF